MKQIIRLTESDLHRLVKESVHRILKESGRGLGYGLPDDEKKALRTQNGGYKPGVERDEIEVDYGGGPFMKSFTRKVNPEGMRQKAHKVARGKKAPLAKSSKYTKHRFPDNGEYDHNDYDEYVEKYLCDKYNGVYLDGYIAVPVDDRWGDEAYDIAQDFKKYGYGQDESIDNDTIETDLMYDDSGYQFDPETDYITFRKGKSTSYYEWDDPGAFGYGPSNPYGEFKSSKLGDTPRIGTSEFMKQNGQQ